MSKRITYTTAMTAPISVALLAQTLLTCEERIAAIKFVKEQLDIRLYDAVKMVDALKLFSIDRDEANILIDIEHELYFTTAEVNALTTLRKYHRDDTGAEYICLSRHISFKDAERVYNRVVNE